MGAINIDHLKKLPDEEKAQIAHILLNSERKKMSGTLLQLPVLTLLRHTAASNICVRFLRVSGERQGSEGFSLSAQEKFSDEYLSKNGLKCDKTWAVTESASRELDRKEFFDMLRYVSENGIKNVIFDKVDRACRGLRAAVFIEDLVEAGVRFHFTRDGLVIDKHSPPSDKLRFYLGVILAKYYIDNLKTEIHKGLKERWEKGYWNGLAPIGYNNVRDDSGRAWIEIDRKLAPYIAEIFELYVTGNYSYKALEQHLAGKAFVEKELCEEKNGELIRSTERHPVKSRCIENILCNPFYYGARRSKGMVTMNGNEKHVPIISKELFDACQKIKAIRARNYRISLAREVQKPYMNFFKCAVCDHAVTGEVHKKKSGKIYIYYHCANQSCDQRSINVRQEAINEQLQAAFTPFARLTPKAVKAFIEGIMDRIGNIQIYSCEDRVRLNEKKVSIENRGKTIKAMIENGELSEAEGAEVMRQKDKLLHEVEVEIDAHTRASQKTYLSGLGVIELLQKASVFMELDANELDKARLAKLVLSNPTLEDGKVRFDYKKPFDDLIELTTLRNWWT